MRQYNHSAQDYQPTFLDVVESFKSSPRYMALSEGSKKEYAKPIERLLKMGSNLVIQTDMQMQVAVASSRSDLTYWYAKIVAAKVTDYEKGRLVLFLKMLYRSQGIGNLVEALTLPRDMRHERRDANPLTKEDVLRVLTVEKPELVTYAKFVAFCFFTGMRPSEVRALKWEHVGDEFIHVVGGKDRQKGVVSRMVPILPEIRSLLEYCKSLGGDYVFVSAMGLPLNKDVVCQKVRQVYALVGIKGVLYDTRRGLVTEMFRKGYSLSAVADLVGHKSIHTTERYRRMSLKEKATNYKGV